MSLNSPSKHGATLNDIIVDDDGTGTAANAGIVVSGATLTLTGGTQIQGGGAPDNLLGKPGTLTVGGGGKLLVSGAATLDGVAVTNGGSGIDVSGAVLTLDDNTVISGSTLTVESTAGSQLLITTGGGTDGASAGGATLDAVAVTDSNATGIDVTSGALTLDGATSIAGGGGLAVESGGQLVVTTGGATLNDIIVDDDGTGTAANAGIVVSGATLTLTGGTQIQGGGAPDNLLGKPGTLTVGGGGKLLVSGAATLDGVAVTNGGSGIDVSGAVLTLDDNTVISGSTLTVESTAGSQLLITTGGGTDGASAGGATLDAVAVTDSNATGIDVTSGALTLDGATSIAGGGGLAVESGGQLVVTTGGATLNDIIVDDDGTGTAANAGIVVSGATLTLTGGTQIQGGGAPDNLLGKPGTLTVGGGGKLLVSGAATLDGVAVTNGGSGIDVSGAVLTLDDNTVISGSTLTVESTAGSQLLITTGGGTDGASAGGATLDAVAVTDSNATGIDVTSGALTLDGATSIAGGGGLAVESGGQLVVTTGGATLNDIIVDDDGTGTAANAGIVVSGATLTLTGGTQIQGGGAPDNLLGKPGTLTVGGGGKLLVSGAATLDGVAVTNGGSGIDVSGAVLTLDDNTVISGSTLTVESTAGSQLLITTGGGTDGASAGGATLDAVAVTDSNATGIDVTSGALTLDGATSIAGGGGLAVESGGQLVVTTGGATLNDIIVDDDGTGTAANAGIVVSGATLTLTGGTQIQGGGAPDNLLGKPGTLTVGGGGKLLVSGAATLDGVAVTNGGSGIDVSGAVLTLDDNTVISGSTLTVESTAGSQLLITTGGGTDGASAGGATLDAVAVTDSNATGIDVTSGALTLDGATSIAGGGGLAVESGGQLVVTTGGATLNDIIVDDDGTGTAANAGIVVSGATLTLTGGTQIQAAASRTICSASRAR